MPRSALDAVIREALAIVNRTARPTRRRRRRATKQIPKRSAPPVLNGTYLRDGVLYRAGRRVWTAEDDRVLTLLYPDAPNDVIGRFLGRTVEAIYGRAEILGVHKSAMYLASPAACRLRRGQGAGILHRFPKGHVPANKGLRRPGWGPGRMKETQFKKGVPSWRTMPIGSTRLVDGYVYRKISDVQFVPWTRNWKQEHYVVWEAERGPVPRGHKLVFRNGDRLDIRVENLELVTDAELMARNTVHNLPPELASTIHLLGQLKRRIRERGQRAGEEQDQRSA